MPKPLETISNDGADLLFVQQDIHKSQANRNDLVEHDTPNSRLNNFRLKGLFLRGLILVVLVVLRRLADG